MTIPRSLGERISGSREQIAASGTQRALVTGDHSERVSIKLWDGSPRDVAGVE